MKFNSAKCQAGHLGTNNSNLCYKRGRCQLDVTEAQKDLGVLVNHSMTVSCQCDEAVKRLMRSSARYFQ